MHIAPIALQPPRVSLTPPPATVEIEAMPAFRPWPDRRFIVLLLTLLAAWPFLLEAVYLLFPLP